MKLNIALALFLGHQATGEKLRNYAQQEIDSTFDFPKERSTIAIDSVTNNSTRVIVKYSSEAGKREAIERSSGYYNEFPDEGALVLEMDNEAITELTLADNDIVDISEDYIWTALGDFVRYADDEPFDGERRLAESIPYGISHVQGNQVSVGSNPVTVCICDTGVAYNHPDLNQRNIRGANRASSDGSTLRFRQDYRGHGTHIAGTVAAVSNNGIGVRGVGNIRLYVTRGLGDDGTAREADILEAIKQCESYGADVISLSLGGGGVSPTFKDVITRIYNSGTLIVAAAGNNGKNIAIYPAALPEVVSVAAIGEDYNRWSGSNYGNFVEVAAPGDLVLSTVPKGSAFGYAYYSGTSMAAPHVAGVAAILMSNYPQCTNRQIRYAMAYSAMSLANKSGGGGQRCNDAYGWGLVQAKAALDFLSRNDCTSASWGRSTVTTGCSAVDRSP